MTLCNHECSKCPAHDGNRPPAFCMVMNSEIAAWDAVKDHIVSLVNNG